jgi:hypothetical protein
MFSNHQFSKVCSLSLLLMQHIQTNLHASIEQATIH